MKRTFSISMSLDSLDVDIALMLHSPPDGDVFSLVNRRKNESIRDKKDKLLGTLFFIQHDITLPSLEADGDNFEKRRKEFALWQPKEGAYCYSLQETIIAIKRAENLWEVNFVFDPPDSVQLSRIDVLTFNRAQLATVSGQSLQRLFL